MQEFSGLDTELARLCAAGEIPGVVAMVASRDAIIYHSVHGLSHADQAAPMRLDTIFWVASMTKSITTVAALQLLERGLLTLDGPAAELVPELADTQVLEGFDAAGVPILRSARSPVTLRNLLTHTSGTCYDMWNQNMKTWLAWSGTPSMASGRLAALKVPLTSDPGTRWTYGIGIDFAGRMVEAASGQKLDEYFRQHIFQPLGMADTSFHPSPDQEARRAGMHRRGADGRMAVVPFRADQKAEFVSGGGGLFSTAPDYVRFLQMILKHGVAGQHRILSPESVARMCANQIGELDVTKLHTAIPGLTGDVEFWPGLPKKWSFGFMINTLPTPEGRSAGSLGWAGLSNCYYWLDPQQDRIGVILMQFLPFNDSSARTAYAALERAVYGR